MLSVCPATWDEWAARMEASCGVWSAALTVPTGIGRIAEACFGADCTEISALGKMSSLLLVLSKPWVLLLLI